MRYRKNIYLFFYTKHILRPVNEQICNVLSQALWATLSLF